MPRKGHVQKREILPDPMYNSKLVTSLIDHLMIDGKRGTATKILYAAFDEIKNETGNDPVEVFQQAMENVMPVLEVKARRPLACSPHMRSASINPLSYDYSIIIEPPHSRYGLQQGKEQ